MVINVGGGIRSGLGPVSGDVSVDVPGFLEEKRYIKWSTSDAGGTFVIACKGDKILYEIVSGSAIPFDHLIKFLWSHPALERARELAKSIQRLSRWRVTSRTGMSGCVDWQIQYLDVDGMIGSTDVLHNSMNGYANQTFDVWVKDLFDTLWHFEKEGLYKSAFSELNDGKVTFIDLTERERKIKEDFLQNSNEYWQGFGSEKNEMGDKLLIT